MFDDCFDPTRYDPDGSPFDLPASACAGQADTPTVQSSTDDPTTEWPAGRSRGPDRLLPAWANDYLAPPGTAPAGFPTGSLSQYYHLNSGGRLTLTA